MQLKLQVHTITPVLAVKWPALSKAYDGSNDRDESFYFSSWIIVCEEVKSSVISALIKEEGSNFLAR